MAFKLRDIVRDLPEELVNPFICPTNKTPYRTKREAERALKQINKHQRRNMRSFRCGYCDHYHLGHRRGEP